MIVYLMRGLPSTGKSTRARELAGSTGVVCETDQFFYALCGDDPCSYDYDPRRIAQARAWNLAQFEASLREQRSPIVVDRGNGLNAESQRYVVLAHRFDYRVELAEPCNPLWNELRILLKYRQHVSPQLLDEFARMLTAKSRHAHRVPFATIRHWMEHWKWDVTVEDILAYSKESELALPSPTAGCRAE